MNNPYTDVLCPHCGEFVDVIDGECANCGEEIRYEDVYDDDEYEDEDYEYCDDCNDDNEDGDDEEY